MGAEFFVTLLLCGTIDRAEAGFGRFSAGRESSAQFDKVLLKRSSEKESYSCILPRRLILFAVGRISVGGLSYLWVMAKAQGKRKSIQKLSIYFLKV